MFLIDKANTPSAFGASLYYLVKKRVNGQTPLFAIGMEKPGVMSARLQYRMKGT
jgi:hypothetical protein